jgi:putative ATP-dependent endonuclease of OLD family
MVAESIRFRGSVPFCDTWSELKQIKPVNVIIGKNNTGKSRLLDHIELLCANSPFHEGVEYECEGILQENELRSVFPESLSSGRLGGNHWYDHGNQLVGKRIIWQVNSSKQITSLEGEGLDSPRGHESTAARIEQLKSLAINARHVLSGKNFRRLLADRDIQSEAADSHLLLSNDGKGATNIIRRFIVSSSPQLPHELVQSEMLDALQSIFATDGKFSEIQIRQHDEESSPHAQGNWEIFLGEEKKGLIPLSKSGSGLKTLILVLLNLLVVPKLANYEKSEFVFAFEELENNLHPALLRRLFQYIEEYALSHEANVFLTTHSSVALDFFGVSKSAQIIHVTHNGESAQSTEVSAHFDHLGVISELGVKPSDLLQANGIIWVEGPSDCIYLNRWVDIFSDGRLQEGRDYQCAFYGGSLLARAQFTSPEEAEAELVNLFRVNSNIVVVCDGDRPSDRAKIKGRVRKISNQVNKIKSAGRNVHMWITKAREIENYLSGEIIARVLGRSTSHSDPTQYQLFFPRKGAQAGSSYIESVLGRKGLDKMDLAIQAAPFMEKNGMSNRFELGEQMANIVDQIQKWQR